LKQYAYPDLKSMPDVCIDTDKPLLERVLDYIDKVKNPYFMRFGGILVKIEYAETEITIEDCMEGYFRSLTLNHSIDI
jgi:hypothetical protein